MLVLRVLRTEPLHGYAIAQRIRAVSDSVLEAEEGSASVYARWRVHAREPVTRVPAGARSVGFTDARPSSASKTESDTGGSFRDGVPCSGSSGARAAPAWLAYPEALVA